MLLGSLCYRFSCVPSVALTDQNQTCPRMQDQGPGSAKQAWGGHISVRNKRGTGRCTLSQPAGGPS